MSKTLSKPLAVNRRVICSGPSIHTYFDVKPESPDGKHLCYFLFDGKPLDHGRVMITDLDGSNARTVIACPATPHGAAQQSWLDNEHIYFSANGCVYIADLNGKIINKIPGAIDTLHRGTRRGLACTKNFTSCGSDAVTEEACFRIDLDDGSMHQLLNRDQAWALLPAALQAGNLDYETLHFKHTKWSPDGTQWFVVFTNEGPARRKSSQTRIKSIIAVNDDGSHPRYISEFGHHPDWLPDASAIYAFEHGSNKLLQWDPKTARQSLLAEMPCAGHPSVHPQLQLISTDAHGSGRTQVVVLNRQSGEHQCIYDGPYPEVDWQQQHPGRRVCHAHPVWSGDGKRLYVNEIVGDMPQLVVYDFDN